MSPSPRAPNAAEAEAVAAARALIAARAEEGRHHIASTVITGSGRAHTGIHLDSTLGRAAICAEAVAVGMAMTAEAGPDIVFSVAVNRRLAVVPPCGVCRELLLDYGPEARIAVPGGEDYLVVGLADLVPHAYKATLRGRRSAEELG